MATSVRITSKRVMKGSPYKFPAEDQASKCPQCKKGFLELDNASDDYNYKITRYRCNVCFHILVNEEN